MLRVRSGRSYDHFQKCSAAVGRCFGATRPNTRLQPTGHGQRKIRRSGRPAAETQRWGYLSALYAQPKRKNRCSAMILMPTKAVEARFTMRNEIHAQSWAKNIFAITLIAEDLDKSKHFYQHVFGLPLVFEDSDSAVYKIGETMINLLKVSAAHELVEPAKVGDRSAGPRQVFTISVTDVDAICRELASKGVKPKSGPIDRPWGIRTANFEDPSGNIWEIAKS